MRCGFAAAMNVAVALNLICKRWLLSFLVAGARNGPTLASWGWASAPAPVSLPLEWGWGMRRASLAPFRGMRYASSLRSSPRVIL